MIEQTFIRTVRALLVYIRAILKIYMKEGFRGLNITNIAKYAEDKWLSTFLMLISFALLFLFILSYFF